MSKLFVLILMVLNTIAVYYLYKHFNSTHTNTHATITKHKVEPRHIAFVINLDHNADRLNMFMDTYKKSELANVDLEKIRAVNGRQLSLVTLQDLTTPDVYQGLRTIDATNRRASDDVLTRGMIGCYLSHIDIYKRFLRESYETCIVFEDDAYFNGTINNALNINLPEDWDMVLLGTVKKFKTEHVDTYFEKVYSFWGTQGYLINKKGARKLLENAFPISKQIDGYMSEMAEAGELNIYSFKANLVAQVQYNSDVQMTVG